VVLDRARRAAGAAASRRPVAATAVLGRADVPPAAGARLGRQRLAGGAAGTALPAAPLQLHPAVCGGGGSAGSPRCSS
jgi:hypothetical protein